MDIRGHTFFYTPLLLPLLLSHSPSLAPSLPLPLLLGRTSLDPSYNSHFSATSLGSSLLLSSGHHCSLFSLPSLLSKHWPGHGSTWPGPDLCVYSLCTVSLRLL